MGGPHARGRGVVLRRASGELARRLAPRSIAALEEVARLREQVERLTERLEETRDECAELRRLAAAAGDDLRGVGADVGALTGRVGELEGDVAESRRLSLRVAQLSDLVFDRLAEAPGRRVSVD